MTFRIFGATVTHMARKARGTHWIKVAAVAVIVVVGYEYARGHGLGHPAPMGGHTDASKYL